MGRIRSIVAKKWNSAEVKHVPGVVGVLLGDDVLIDSRGKKVHTAITAFLDVRREYYVGPLPIKATGFKDEQTGGLVTRQITTEFIEPHKIENGEVKGWAKLDSPQALSVEVHMKMEYSDLLPVPEAG